MNERQFSVQSQHYQGPLDVLLLLVEKRKLYIHDLSLSSVTDDFIAYMTEHADVPLYELSDFLRIASTLLLIKSAALVPDLTLSSSEQVEVEELHERLKLYSVVKAAARKVAMVWHTSVTAELPPLRTTRATALPPLLSVQTLHAAALRTLTAAHLSSTIPSAHVASVRSFEDVVKTVLERILSSEYALHTLYNPLDTEDVLLHFLAVLELVKDQRLDAVQETDFSPLYVSSAHIGMLKL
jgi:segregation and condensation protein A